MNQPTDTNQPKQAEPNTLKGVRLPINRYVLFCALAFSGLAVDLYTKTYFFDHYHDSLKTPNQVDWWLNGILGVQTSFNGGALFGMFQGQSFALAGLSLIALVGIMVWLFWFKMAISRWLTVALGLIAGGIVGNLYDRMGFGYVMRYGEQHTYHVRDWIHFRLQGVPFCDPWPNFNIADSLLVTGAVMLFLFALFVPDPTASKSAKSDA